jgi:hypothetical protein
MSDPCDYKKQLETARQYTALHIVTLARELLERDETGVLPNGRMRELRDLCTFAGIQAMLVAESLVKKQALLLVSRG